MHSYLISQKTAGVNAYMEATKISAGHCLLTLKLVESLSL